MRCVKVQRKLSLSNDNSGPATQTGVGGQVSLPTGGHLDLPADGHLAAGVSRLTGLFGCPPTALRGHPSRTI